MGYLHIQNTYRKEAQILFFLKEVYALEKVDGTSAHISWKDNQLLFASGGADRATFISMFNEQSIIEAFEKFKLKDIVIYGEAYGGKVQKKSHIYGNQLRFVVFDIKINDNWLNVPKAKEFAETFGLRFVDYVKCTTDLNDLDFYRDLTSTEAIRNGIEGFQPREGIVIRPIVELFTVNGERLIFKHKRPENRETKTERKINELIPTLLNAEMIAEEYVTEMRLNHILDKLQNINIPKDIGKVVLAMKVDIYREASGEIKESTEAARSISQKTVLLLKNRFPW